MRRHPPREKSGSPTVACDRVSFFLLDILFAADTLLDFEARTSVRWNWLEKFGLIVLTLAYVKLCRLRREDIGLTVRQDPSKLKIAVIFSLLFLVLNAL